MFKVFVVLFNLKKKKKKGFFYMGFTFKAKGILKIKMGGKI